MTTDHKNIDEAILAVIAEAPVLEKTGTLSLGTSRIKTLTNDEVLDKIRPLTIEHGIVVYPIRVTDAPQFSLGGTPLTQGGAPADDTRVRPIRINRMLTYDFEFVHVASQTSRVVQVPGEGMGNDDKGSRKATTSAQKTAYILVFELVTGEPDPDNEPDAQSEAPGAKQADRSVQQRAVAKTPGARSAATPPRAASTSPQATIAAGKVETSPTVPSEPASQADPESLEGLKGRMRVAVGALGGPQVFTRIMVDEIGATETGKADRSDWINSPALLKKVVVAVEAKVNAAHDPNEPVA